MRAGLEKISFLHAKRIKKIVVDNYIVSARVVVVVDGHSLCAGQTVSLLGLHVVDRCAILVHFGVIHACCAPSHSDFVFVAALVDVRESRGCGVCFEDGFEEVFVFFTFGALFGWATGAFANLDSGVGRVDNGAG